MKKKTSIVIVDDERNILNSLSLALTTAGYLVRTYSEGVSALDALTREPADLAILDIKMPRMDGMELLRRLRELTDMPVIFLTSKTGETDHLDGLRNGADDYICKPYSVRKVIQRVEVVLRRSQLTDESRAAHVLERGKLRLDSERHTCQWGTRSVQLSGVEFKILEALAIHPGSVKSRDALIDAADDDQVDIESHIKRLRKKFKSIDENFDLIETLYGIGYRFKE